MKITVKQNQDFEDAVTSGGMYLPNAIEWIRDNLKPYQVFSVEQIQECIDSSLNK